MRIFVTAVVAAIEAAAIAVASLVVIAMPAVLLWVVTFDLDAEPLTVVSTTASIWQLAHFVPLSISIGAEDALVFGLAPEALRFTVSLAPLGLSAVTAALAARSGVRLGRQNAPIGILGGALGFAGAAGVLSVLAHPGEAAFPLGAILVPPLVFVVPATAAFLFEAARRQPRWWVRATESLMRLVARSGARHPNEAPRLVAATVTVVVASLAALTLLAAVAVAVALAVGYARVIALSQALQLDALGSLAMLLGQLVFLPVVLIWGVAWLTGAGFGLGEGGSLSPFEALSGPLPPIPMLGAIPDGWGSLALLAPASVVIAGVVVGALFAPRTLRGIAWTRSVPVLAVAAIATGLVTAGAVGLASGSIGPGRFVTTGADPWLVGGLAAGEIGLGLLLGFAAARVDYSRVRAVLPEPVSQALDARDRASSSDEYLPMLDGGDDHATEPLAGLESLSGLDRVDGRRGPRAARETSEAQETLETQETQDLGNGDALVSALEDARRDALDPVADDTADTDATAALDTAALDVEDAGIAPVGGGVAEPFDAEAADKAAEERAAAETDSGTESLTSTDGVFDAERLVEEYSWDAPEPEPAPEAEGLRGRWRRFTRKR